MAFACSLGEFENCRIWDTSERSLFTTWTSISRLRVRILVQFQPLDPTNPEPNWEFFLRVVDAIDYSEQHGEVCPANWKKGEKAMKPTAESLKQYMSTK